MRRRRSKHDKASRWRRPSTWIVGALAVVLVVPLIYVAYLNAIVAGIRRAPLLPTFDGPQGRGTNVLLLASEKDDSMLRVDSDTLLVQLVHFSADHRTAAIIHFPRRLALSPEKGSKRTTLVAAHRKDGAAGIADLLQQRLKLRIDHVTQIDFDAYVEMTDHLGGVDLSDDKGGPLSGKQALAWTEGAEGPKRESEVVLGRRHQDWERSLMRDMLRPGVVLNPFTVVGLLTSVADHSVLDETFSTRAVRSLAWRSRKLTPSQLIFFTAPLDDFAKAAAAEPDQRLRADEASLDRLGELLAVDNTTGIATFDN